MGRDVIPQCKYIICCVRICSTHPRIYDDVRWMGAAAGGQIPFEWNVSSREKTLSSLNIKESKRDDWISSSPAGTADDVWCWSAASAAAMQGKDAAPLQQPCVYIYIYTYTQGWCQPDFFFSYSTPVGWPSIHDVEIANLKELTRQTRTNSPIRWMPK